MKYMWVAAAFVGMLLVGILVGIFIGGRGAQQGGAAPSPRTVTVERTVQAQSSKSKTTPSPAAGTTTATAAPAHSVGSLAEARSAFERAVEGYSNPNLKVGEVMEFANNYYAEVKEKDTHIGAMELLINKSGSRVYPEPGPNMMWNTKYGMMSRGGYGHMIGPNGGGMMGPNGRGMMGGYGSSAPPRNTQGHATNDKMPVSTEQAKKIADAYLSGVSPGTKAEEPTRFYGYYTVDTERDGKTVGMLSVNGYSGEVWYHSWHGPFIAKQEEGA